MIRIKVVSSAVFLYLLLALVPLVCMGQNDCFDVNGDCTLATPEEYQVQLIADCGETIQLQPTNELCNTWTLPGSAQYENGIGADSFSVYLFIDQCFDETIVVDGITNTPSGSGVASCNTSIIYTITPQLDTMQQELYCRDYEALTSTSEWIESSCGCDSLLVEYILLEEIDTTYITTTSCDPADIGQVTETYESIITGCDSVSIITTELIESQEIELEGGQACAGEPIVLDAFIDDNTSYLWSTGETASFIEVIDAGVYTVTVTDGNQCEIIASAEALYYDINIDLISSVIGPLLLSESPLEVWQGAAVEIRANVTGTTFPFEIIWNGGPEVGDTILNYIALESGELKAAVVDSIGCIGIETTDVIVHPISVFVPSGFSPNQDGNNEILNVYTSPNVEELRLQIFSRSGSLVFDQVLQATAVDGNGWQWTGWDGYFNNKLMHPQVFVYQLWYRGIRGEWMTTAGDVTLVR